ncbi:DUF4126 family protein [Mucilaginibacter sp.]|uniref:DUF4126 family protein n=1 Tax=Mucilaginibacter sp. TaxID=1882438 RepID=UPI0035BC44DD
MKRSNIVLQTIGLGAVAGMRATMAPAVASHYLSNHPNPALSRSVLRFIQLPVTALVTKLLSIAEVTGDKIPNGPNRIELPQVLARVASGAFVGATIFKANRKSILEGMVLGGVSALAATYATFYARKYADRLPFIKEPFSGIVEDAVALGTGISILKA